MDDAPISCEEAVGGRRRHGEWGSVGEGGGVGKGGCVGKRGSVGKVGGVGKDGGEMEEVWGREGKSYGRYII